MNLRTSISVAMGLMGVSLVANAESNSLAAHRWTHRILVVVAPAPQDTGALAQRRIFQRASKGMTERDVVLIEAAGEDPQARDIRRQLAVDSHKFQVLLIGKDGNTVLSSNAPLTAGDLFGRIDAMPMRRDEIRRKRQTP